MSKQLKIIAKIKTDFPSKFGIPRQSGLVENKSQIIFENEFRDESAFRGLEKFSHLWIIWEFSENEKDNWSATVRPPRLGGNKRVGVFATRSPFRPNSIGLSSVKIEKIFTDQKYGTIIEVSGADLMDGTPIYDIKPYIAYSDSHPDAVCGFSDDVFSQKLEVVLPSEIAQKIPKDKITVLKQILQGDPRPHYHNDAERVYAFEFSKYHIEFKVENNILTVLNVEDR